jgi:AcrR family transcriptional regulator
VSIASGERAAGTRRALLAAARQVFTESGFTEAAIADVVGRAGASVGSLYHHFGGKADLYLALYEDYATRQEARAAAAVTAARAAGETDPVRLFLAGGRAFLAGCWEERDLARLFLAGGGPPGFELLQRRRNREWIRRNASLLRGPGEEPNGEADALVLVLTTVMGAAGHEVALAESEQAARRLAGEVLALIGRIARPD